MTGYPRWFRQVVIVAMVVLSVSGWLLIPTAVDFRMDYDVGWRLSGADRIAVVSMHVLAAFAICIVAGAAGTRHIPAGLRRSRNVYSGLSLVTALSILLMSSVGVLYAGGRLTSIVSSATHTLFGAFVSLGFVVHVVRARKWRNGTTRV